MLHLGRSPAAPQMAAPHTLSDDPADRFQVLRFFDDVPSLAVAETDLKDIEIQSGSRSLPNGWSPARLSIQVTTRPS
jgi:hypothetical protein